MAGWLTYDYLAFIVFIMDIYQANKALSAISSGLKDAVLGCMESNKELIEDLVREQLYSGLDGDGEYLSPSYDNDPYFQKDGPWKGRAQQYKEWKAKITPPIPGITMGIAARPIDIPNLFIDGTFHKSIKSRKEKDGLQIYTSGFRDGPSIEHKYGEHIFNLTDMAKDYFMEKKLKEHIEDFFNKCINGLRM